MNQIDTRETTLIQPAARTRGARAAELLVGALALAALILLLAMAPGVLAATYKWVDDKGVVHYTDKMPNEAVGKGSTMLDKQARPVKKIEPPPTAEQFRAREAEEEQRRILAKSNEEIARRDRALVASYTTEAEIDLARSRALGTIDAQVDSSNAYVVQLTKRKEELSKRRAGHGTKPLPAALERELESTDNELEKTAALLEQKRKERLGVVSRYDQDKARWRELKDIAESSDEIAAGNARSHPSAAPGVARK